MDAKKWAQKRQTQMSGYKKLTDWPPHAGRPMLAAPWKLMSLPVALQALAVWHCMWARQLAGAQ